MPKGEKVDITNLIELMMQSLKIMDARIENLEKAMMIIIKASNSEKLQKGFVDPQKIHGKLNPPA